MDISTLLAQYREGSWSPEQEIAGIYERIRTAGERPVWITIVPEKQNLARASELGRADPERRLPLHGIPFAVKDNLDVAGLTTTAGCPAFAYTPEATAFVVQRLLDAGAILIGKTNMDQFATGLVGTRTPYGICSSVFHSAYVSGGSSSGSAVAVAQGLLSFALGTDTAGSGRVPAAFNQLVGLKPTRGLLSTSGLVPACRSLDCVSIFAETCADAEVVFRAVAAFDPGDPWSRATQPGADAAPWSASAFRFGVPAAAQREFFGDDSAAEMYERTIHALEQLGGEAIEIDYTPLRDAAQLLYGGPWVAERRAAIGDFAERHGDRMDSTVRGIIAGADRHSAVDAFRAEYQVQELRREAEAIFDAIDLLLLPTAPTQYTIREVADSPVQLNTNLGYYTNFVNLLDLAAVAVPAGFKANGLPFGVSLIGPAFSDRALLAVADRLHRARAATLGGGERKLSATPPLLPCPMPPGCVLIAVVGAHLTGQPLNWQMTARRARLVRSTKTDVAYRLYALAHSTPAKPGLVWSPGYDGPGIDVEVWAMPEDTVGSFLAGIPAPLGLGSVRLQDGSQVKGFICESAGVADATEITHLGGWRQYLLTRSPAAS